MLFMFISKTTNLNSALTKSDMDFFSVIIGFFIQTNMGLETKILSQSILDVEASIYRPNILYVYNGQNEFTI